MTPDAPIFSAVELQDATGGVPLRGRSEWSCRGISTDTRTLSEGNLFIALSGENFDGHDCLAEAARKGAAGLIIRMDRTATLGGATAGPPVIGVPDTLAALGDIAHAWRRRFTAPVLAITGSAGKTTTKEMVLAIASRSRNVLFTEGNLNNLIGLPFTLLRMRPSHALAVVELGTNRPGEIARLAAIASPDIGLITNVGAAHLEGLGSIEAVREEKGALFAALGKEGTAILNGDDGHIGILAARWPGKRIVYGLGPGAEVTAEKISPLGAAGVRFDLIFQGAATEIQLAIPGRHNVQNALAATAASLALGFGRQEIVAGLAAFRPVPGRMEIRPLANGAFLIMDAYNANPASVREALLTLKTLRDEGRSIAVLGDMLELGPEAGRLHEEIGALAAKTGVGTLFLKGELTRTTAAGAIRRGFPRERIVFFMDPETVVERLQGDLKKGDWILVKGSRKMKLEAVAEAIISAFDLRT
ncbi:MAG: UDP-N-acetylmuramoyl-tripeptide--D-alanyl-D-alanine ligase [Deltaproteobacteria bacterium]|nr:UDP-N-acetylmuramoyl-tripeptide--D-alanyl-D-alanine ligase [Deltaproteobacteria bacterium]